MSRDSDFYKHLLNSQIEQYYFGKKNTPLTYCPLLKRLFETIQIVNKKMILNFHPEQTLEYIRLLFQCNNHLEAKNRTLMKIEHCFPYHNYNHKLCPRLLCLDNRPNYQTQYVILNPQIQIPHQI